jgi:ABC transporter transmembrane region
MLPVASAMPVARAHEVLHGARWGIGASYGITVVENLFWLLYPFTTGRAIDGLLAGRGAVALWPLGTVWLLHVGLGAFRQVFDTRVFARVYAELATETVVRQRTAGIATAEIAARTVMARELVDFLERELPLLATAALGLVGSLVMLFVYDRSAGALVSVLVVPVLGVYRLFARRARVLNARLNDLTEREVDLIASGEPATLATHYRTFGEVRLQLSRAEAGSWSMVELCSIAAVSALLLHATSAAHGPGTLYAMLAYVWRVLEALDQAPLLVQRVSRLFDVRRRLDLAA